MGIKVVDPLNIAEWINVTEGVKYIPIRRNIAGDLGLFSSEYLDDNTAILPVTTVNDYKLVDIPWGTRLKNTLRDGKSRLRLEVPHFGVEDSIRPLDVKGKIDFDDFILQNRPESVNSFMDKKKEKARQAVVNTWSDAMIGLIRDGTAYAPNGTIVNNYFTAFGVAQSSLTIDLTQVNNPKTSIQAAIDNIVDNFKGGYVPSTFLALTGRTFFDALVTHPFVLENARIYQSEQQSVEVLTGILGTQVPDGVNLNKRYQVLDFGGVIWVRVSSSTEILPDEARLFPTDLPDLFKIFFAPSDLTFDSINETAQEDYYWEKMEPDRTALNFVYETNFLVATLWPKSLVKLTAQYV